MLLNSLGKEMAIVCHATIKDTTSQEQRYKLPTHLSFQTQNPAKAITRKCVIQKTAGNAGADM